MGSDTGNTDLVEYNTVVGFGYSTGQSFGIAIASGGGTATGNQFVWWDTADKFFYDYNPATLSSTNTKLPRKACSLSKEESLYSQWQTLTSQNGIQVGYGTNPGVAFHRRCA